MSWGGAFSSVGAWCRVQVTDDLHWMEVADVAYAAFDKLPLPRDCHVEKDADTNGGYRSKSNVDISTFQQQISNWVQFQFLKMTKGCWKAVRCSQQGCDDNGKRVGWWNTKLVFHTWRQFVLHSDNPTGFDTRPRCSWARFFQQEPSGNSWIRADKDFFERKLLMHKKYEEGKFLLNPDLGYLL